MSSFWKLGFSIVVLMNRRVRNFFAVPGLAVLALLANGAFSAAQVPLCRISPLLAARPLLARPAITLPSWAVPSIR